MSSTWFHFLCWSPLKLKRNNIWETQAFGSMVVSSVWRIKLFPSLSVNASFLCVNSSLLVSESERSVANTTTMTADRATCSGQQTRKSCTSGQVSACGMQPLYMERTWNCVGDLDSIFAAFWAIFPSPCPAQLCSQDFVPGTQSCHRVIWPPEIMVYGRLNFFPVEKDDITTIIKSNCYILCISQSNPSSCVYVSCGFNYSIPYLVDLPFLT